MLISASSLKAGPIQGMAFLIQKNWPSSQPDRAEKFLNGISPSLTRILGDSGATKAFVKDLEHTEISDLHMALETSQKQHSTSSYRADDQLCVMARFKKNDTQIIALKEHRIFNLYLENSSGEYFEVIVPQSQKGTLGWHILDTGKIGKGNFANLHICLTNKEPHLPGKSAEDIKDVFHFRIADISLRSNTPYICPSFSVSLL